MIAIGNHFQVSIKKLPPKLHKKFSFKARQTQNIDIRIELNEIDGNLWGLDSDEKHGSYKNSITPADMKSFPSFKLVSEDHGIQVLYFL